MRRQLVYVVAAATAMVAIAFLVPLALLTRDLAADRAVTRAENSAESAARLLVVLGAESLSGTIGSAIGERALVDQHLSIIAPDGTVLAGVPTAPGEDLSDALAGSAYRSNIEGGQVIYVPVVLQTGDVAVVRAFVSRDELTAGVARSLLILGSLGVVLVLLAVAVADRMGRSMVQPIRRLSATAAALGEGDLDSRVTPAGPPEVREVGHALNHMAIRIRRLIEEERETAADLAHRLRTPLTALRLDIEALPGGTDRENLTIDLDEMQRTVDFVIAEARRPVRQDRDRGCDFAAIVADRVEFWRPLGEEQNRTVRTSFAASPILVELPPHDAAALVDALIENVFSHTTEGTSFAVSVAVDTEHVTLVVEDAGVGWMDDDLDVVGRGTSPGGSTGLGLDIVRRTAESIGGVIRTCRSAGLGGAAVHVEMPLATHRS